MSRRPNRFSPAEEAAMSADLTEPHDASRTEMTGTADIAIAGDAQLTNNDLLPVPLRQRTWGVWNFAALWMGMVHSAFGFAVIGGMMDNGMTVLQALLVVLLGNLVQMCLMGFTGRVGARYGIPFAVWARSTFGVLGANIPAALRGIVAIGWFGVQSYLGSTAINVLLETSFSGWRNWNTEFGGVAANLWVSMIIYWALNLLLIRHGMETIRRFEGWAGPLIFVVMIPLVVWAFMQMDGFGPIFDQESHYSSTGSFITSGLLPGIALFISASWATMVLNMPDITRYAKSNKAQMTGLFYGLPIATVVFYGMAAIVVSGTQAATGKTLWNPADVLVAIDNPVVSILGALSIAVATMSVNLAANIISPAFDFTNLFPRWLTFKSAALISIILGFLYMPWKLMESSDTLFSVLNNVGAVIAPATGILIADFYLVRRGRLDVAALYRRGTQYEGYRGYNWWSLSVLIVMSLFCILGQWISAIDWAYEYAAVLGVVLGFVGYLAVVPLARKSSIGAAFEPSGTLGVELDEIEHTAAK
ncbi:nitrate reductase [Gordonia amarae]|uniref:Nitrate reductase n=2 Tax=Gordonia amarae TaxID=36821 RepID=A0A857M6K6_9ACTN|nr:nitrate reductase [Gordonia amarae]QHN20267.1 nitrate reductase [Gordonia amarae]QHN29118.1 nitrate reductase [Gordonia amarae]QHN37898.1 nitrate reductase [Gordonia amarae]